MANWIVVRECFTRIAFRRPIDEIAKAIPASRRTVYRLINGQVQRPTKAVLQGVERIVREDGALEK